MDEKEIKDVEQINKEALAELTGNGGDENE